MAPRVHSLSNIDDYLKRVLCYPRDYCSELEYRVSKLLKAGISNIVEEGEDVLGLKLLGKGYSSIVVLAEHPRIGFGALKIRRIDSRRASLISEAAFLNETSRLGCSPQVYYFDDDFIFMEYLDPSTCRPLDEVVEKVLRDRDYEGLRKVLMEVFRALFTLDSNKLFHRELNRPGDHILICGDRVKVIDWESASRHGKASNIPQMASYLLFRSDYSGQLKTILGTRVECVIESLKAYKNDPSIKNFESFINCFGLGFRKVV
ncbi:serine/threonine protein kinase [Thermogladius sp. 4427co]|uniref:serine/threonine protein kinase n=1 Tax=Thermogladius sp. 4427co TaxID=3450718 RepID=UPI003F7A5CF0